MEPRTRTKRGARLFGRTTGLLALLALAGAALIAACGGDDEVAQVTGLDDRGYHNTSRLVTTEWIEDNLDNDSVLLIDRRGNDDYVAGHIPGAVQTPRTAFQVEIDGVPGVIPPAADVAAALGAIGATPDTTIVLYDGRGSVSASRGLWVLAVYGHADVRLLDGDFRLWESEGHEISTGDADRLRQRLLLRLRTEREADRRLGRDHRLDRGSRACWSATRARPRSTPGSDVRNNDRGGHIPESVNVEWNRAIDENGRFLPADQLRELYDGEGRCRRRHHLHALPDGCARHAHLVRAARPVGLRGREGVRRLVGQEYGNREDSPIDS